MAPYTKVLPKPLMPIGDMPILEILLRQMKRAGIEDVVITVGHLAGLLQAFFQDGGAAAPRREMRRQRGAEKRHDGNPRRGGDVHRPAVGPDE